MRGRVAIVPAAVLVACLAGVGLAGCETSVAGTSHGPNGTELIVFAAASLADVARDLGSRFQERQATAVVFNFAGSNTLAQQISDAGVADVFLSADADWTRFLQDRGLALAGSLRPLFANRLVIVGHRDAAFSIDEPLDLLDPSTRFRHLAVADPAGVPAGRYAQRRLHGLHAPDGGTLWGALADRVAPTLDVRAALALVQSDPEILGVVYRTDVATTSEVRILYEFPADGEHLIHYWGLQVAESGQPAAARAFLEFLATEAAAEIVERHGFESIPNRMIR